MFTFNINMLFLHYIFYITFMLNLSGVKKPQTAVITVYTFCTEGKVIYTLYLMAGRPAHRI